MELVVVLELLVCMYTYPWRYVRPPSLSSYKCIVVMILYKKGFGKITVSFGKASICFFLCNNVTDSQLNHPIPCGLGYNQLFMLRASYADFDRKRFRETPMI